MSQEKTNYLPNQERFELDAEVVRSMVEQQKQKFKLEERQLMLEEKRLEHDIKLAELSLHHNATFLNNAPANHRKLILIQGLMLLALILVILAFIGYCLFLGKEDVVNKLVILFTHLTTLLIGLYLGKRAKTKSSDMTEVESIPGQ
jgi:hypothetical protein